MSTIETDILVIGAGPAGTSAALAAARAGARVLVVERTFHHGEQGPRVGFIPVDFAGDLPVPSICIRQAIRGTRMHVGTEIIEKPWPGWIVRLGEMCLAFAGEAGKLGARMRSGYQLSHLAPTGNARFGSASDNLNVRATVTVAADGATSRAASLIGLPGPRHLAATQCEVPLIENREWVEFYLDPSFTGGYGWLYPMGIVASVGVAAAQGTRNATDKLLAWLRDRLVKEGRVGQHVIRETHGSIPCGGLLPAVRMGQVILAGDAAGTTHPMAVNGITPALVSGRMAGEAAVSFVGGRSGALRDYERDLGLWLGPARERHLAHRNAMEDAWERLDFPSLTKDTCLGF